MLLKGPNKDEDIHWYINFHLNFSLFSYQVDMDFEKTGSKKCIQEFMAKESMDCMVMVKSGFLKMNGCTLSLEYP